MDLETNSGKIADEATIRQNIELHTAQETEATSPATVAQYLLTVIPISVIGDSQKTQIRAICESKSRPADELTDLVNCYARLVFDLCECLVDIGTLQVDINVIRIGLEKIQKDLSSQYNAIQEGDRPSYITEEIALIAELHEILAQKSIWHESGRNNPKSPAQLAEGAKALHNMQKKMKAVLVGDDITVEFPEPKDYVLKPGDFTMVKARIPATYFGDLGTNSGNEVIQALVMGKLAGISAISWLKKPIERSRAAQLSMGLHPLPHFDISDIQQNVTGDILVTLRLRNTSLHQVHRYNGQEPIPAFRLAVEPPSKMLIGHALERAANNILEKADDLEACILRNSAGLAYALRLPVTQYMRQAWEHETEVNMSDILRANGMTRETIDTALGFTDWVQSPSGLSVPSTLTQNRPFIVIGETPPVKFPPDLAGVISQQIWVEESTGGKGFWQHRHGGSRVIDGGFGSMLPGYEGKSDGGQAVRTEVLMSGSGSLPEAQQYLIIYIYPSGHSQSGDDSPNEVS